MYYLRLLSHHKSGAELLQQRLVWSAMAEIFTLWLSKKNL